MDIKELLIIIIIIFILYYFDNTYEGFSIGNVFCNPCADPPEYCPPGNIPCPKINCSCAKGDCVSTCPTHPPPPKPTPLSKCPGETNRGGEIDSCWEVDVLGNTCSNYYEKYKDDYYLCNGLVFCTKSDQKCTKKN